MLLHYYYSTKYSKADSDVISTS